MHVIDTGTIRLCVDCRGSGPRILFLGGTGWDLRQPPDPRTSPLAARFTVALFDQRGMGQSGKPHGPYTIADYAGDAVAVMDALGWDRAHVVGYSFGGMVAQHLAVTAPDRIDRLVLAATTPGGAGGSSYPVERLLDLPAMERARRGLEIADTRFTPEYQRRNPEIARQRIEKRVQAQTAFAHEPRAMEGLRLQLAARAGHDCFDRLPDITAETLVLAGTFDGQADRDIQRRMADRIPGARFAEVPCSHGLLTESDDAYDRMIAFLSA